MAGKIKTLQNAPVIRETNTAPEVTLERKDIEEMVTIIIDREMTDGGLITNGKLMVGEMTLPRHVAEDLQRRQEEYFETKKKLTNKDVTVRMKSDAQKESLFLADPEINQNKATFNRDYGLLGAKEWSYCSETFKQHLLEQRKQMYGY